MAVNTKDKPGENGECTVPYNSKYADCHPVWAPVTIPPVFQKEEEKEEEQLVEEDLVEEIALT